MAEFFRESLRLQERREICQIEFALTVHLERWNMEELIKSAVDFLQSRMKDSPFDSFKIEMAFLKEKLAMEVFKGWEVPGKF